MTPLVPFEAVAPLMLASMVGGLLLGFPVALTLIGHGFAFLLAGSVLGFYPPELMYAQVLRVYGIAYNDTLLAIPFFTLMGMLLERSGIAEDLLKATGDALRGVLRGGLAYAVILVGTLLACTTGVVQASIIAMGLISLPALRASGYPDRLSCGAITASATLAQLIPPSLVLIVMAEVTGVPVFAMYERALVPGLLLAAAYLGYVALRAALGGVPAPPRAASGAVSLRRFAVVMLPPLAIIGCTLGSLLAGVATPTESGAYGALAAGVLAAARRRLTPALLREAADATLLISCAAMFILVGASFFVLPFRGMDGDAWLQAGFGALPAGATGFLVAVALLVFVLAFFLDFFEIAFIVLPLVMPVARALGIDPAWFAVMLCVVLQTSFMHPPFGIALYNLRSVAPPSLPTSAIYWGAVPFILIQLGVAAVLIAWPDLAVPLFARETQLMAPAQVEELLHGLPHPVFSD